MGGFYIDDKWCDWSKESIRTKFKKVEMLNFVFIIPTATFLVDKSQLVIKSITIMFVNVLAHDKGHVSCSPYPDPFAQNNTNISWKIRLDLVRQAQDFSFSL